MSRIERTPGRRDRRRLAGGLAIALAAVLVAAGCREGLDRLRADAGGGEEAGASRRVLSIEGFDSPESVTYDPELDVYYVSTMRLFGSLEDDDAFISRLEAGDPQRGSILVAGGESGAWDGVEALADGRIVLSSWSDPSILMVDSAGGPPSRSCTPESKLRSGSGDVLDGTALPDHGRSEPADWGVGQLADRPAVTREVAGSNPAAPVRAADARPSAARVFRSRSPSSSAGCARVACAR